jgi:hypothetical protein
MALEHSAQATEWNSTTEMVDVVHAASGIPSQFLFDRIYFLAWLSHSILT